jgi:hypothetical protein
MKTIAIVGLLLTASSGKIAIAQDVYGLGTYYCHDWLLSEQQDTPLRDRFLSWATGYFSGINMVCYAQVDADIRHVRAWLTEHCESHRTELFATAVQEFVRQRGGPSFQDGCHSPRR